MLKKNSIDTKISQDYFLIKNQLGISVSTDSSSKTIRILPPQLTAQNLAKFMGVANCCWVLEDFHKVPESERTKLSQIMKIFMDMADIYKNLKIVAIGAVDTARQVVEYDGEMRNRVAEIHIPLMSPEEVSRIITKGGGLLNIDFDQSIIKGISNYANGLASVCHHLCLNICSSQDIYETLPSKHIVNDAELNAALNLYMDEASDTLKKAFEKAFKQERTKKFDNAKLILKALSEIPQEGALRAERYQKIIVNEPNYPQGNLTSFLKKLCSYESDSLIKCDSNSGKYSFNDPLYRSFAIVLFSKDSPKYSGDKNIEKTVQALQDITNMINMRLKNQLLIDILKQDKSK